MSRLVKRRLRALVDALGPNPFRRRRLGIEKESLRVDRAGYISQRPHPQALGSALTHPEITTDFSDALLEFITPPARSVPEVARRLRHLHQFTYPLIGDELLWATSMPCMVTGDDSIPIARYGSSNIGVMKQVYRRGLGHRYGRVMQIISGVHFNFSLSRTLFAAYREIEPGDDESLRDFISRAYFALVRNFHRHGWILLLLFGASPAICRSFMGDRTQELSSFSRMGKGTLFKPFATSLRMSDVGYRNDSQKRLGISCDGLDPYVDTLHRATGASWPAWEALGLLDEQGRYRQLNTNLLQIENEYYSLVRPKQIARSGEKPTVALQKRGVRYVEIRALDVDPFSPVGIEEDVMRFMEAFLIHCLLDRSEAISAAEQAEIDDNQRKVAVRGRDPRLTLQVDSKSAPVFDRARRIVESVREIADILDQENEKGHYARAVETSLSHLDDPQSLPSARILGQLQDSGEDFFSFAMRLSLAHREALIAAPFPARSKARLQERAAISSKAQAELESADRIDFAQYLERYFAQAPQ
ncbi:MAG: glutamate--cysteine ligase [Ectothiorhodospiraceae bacterium AqS1]|nr:glutamate--cysteine ligase [Ectothiorhodospiraceae bacterium AqS1]